MEWTTITDYVKIHIIAGLDYGSRCNLRLCSKEDKNLVDTVGFRAEKFSICEWFSEMANYKTLIRIDIDSFTIWFIGKDNVTKIDRAWNANLLEEYSEIKQENRYDLVRTFLDKYHRKFGFINAKSISLVKFEQPPSANWRIKCDELTLYEANGEWIRRCESVEFRTLEISGGAQMEIDERILRTSESLRLNLDSEMNDEQLTRIKCTDLHVRSDFITVIGAKQFLEYFLTNGLKNDELEITIPLERDFDFRRLIPELVEFKKLKIPEGASSVFRAMLTGGFKNVHVVQENRILRVRFTPEKAEITCEIPKRNRLCQSHSLSDHGDSE